MGSFILSTAERAEKMMQNRKKDEAEAATIIINFIALIASKWPFGSTLTFSVSSVSSGN